MSDTTTADSVEERAQKALLPLQQKRVSTFLYQRERFRLGALLALPMTWLIGVYIVSLLLLLITAFWVVNPFTSRVSPGFTLENFVSLVTVPAYLSTSLRTLGMALAVTGLSVIFAVPLGIYMAKLASPMVRNLLVVAITLPLWAGYLVKILAMRLVFTENGFINWALGPLGVSSPGFNIWVAIITLTYLWFPYMALPVQFVNYH
jgi:putative spermidine/putrescine transport system permease protein